MALATQCPHCQTTFRVAHDQLKLRAGLVRCGACKQIFNGIENLLPPEETEQTSGTMDASPVATTPAADATQQVAATPAIAAPPTPETALEADAESDDDATIATTTGTEADEAPKEDPLLRMTLMDFTHREPASATEPSPQAEAGAADALEQAIDDLQQKPWRNTSTDAPDSGADELDQADQREYEEPSFVTQGRRRQRIGRVLHLTMALGLPLLLIALAAQSVYTFRDRIAAQFPQTRPILDQVCRHLDCQVGLPAQIDDVSLESSELQTLSAAKNTFVLAILLRNRSTTVQAWPSMELTLNDAGDKVLARRVFMPRDYLPATQEIDKGFAPRSEQPVKLYFSLSGQHASGYSAYLFYP